MPPFKPYRLPRNVWFPYKNCTKEKADKFILEYHTKNLDPLEALIIGLPTTTESNDDPLVSGHNTFKSWTLIMFKQAAKHLLGHKPDDYTIDLK
jgi:hypothetical protein